MVFNRGSTVYLQIDCDLNPESEVCLDDTDDKHRDVKWDKFSLTLEMLVPAMMYPILKNEGAQYVVRHGIATLLDLELDDIGNITIITMNGLEVMECLMDKLIRLRPFKVGGQGLFKTLQEIWKI